MPDRQWSRAVRATAAQHQLPPPKLEEILFREELEQFARKHPHLSLEITATQPSPHWSGQTGRINKHKIATLNTAPNTLFYLCGPQGMVEDMSNLLRELDVPASRVIFEK